MAYTGFTFERLLEQRDLYIPLLHEIDVLIDGPFVESERSFDLNFKGSSNQRILDMRETLKTDKPVLYRM